MRLAMGTFPVRDVQLGTRTAYENGVLHVDAAALRALILKSGDFADVRLEVLRPGDAVRVIHVMDAAEPRCKLDGGSDFPGFVGAQKTVGEGRTHRLAGMAVLTVSDAVAGEPTYWREAIVDMSGPAAVATPFGTTINLVLHLTPAAEYLDESAPEAVLHNIMIGSALAQRWNRVVRAVELEVAAYLARATADLTPETTDWYDLQVSDPSLPRVVYFFQINGVALYGLDPSAILPSLIHPCEILDGALIGIRSNSHASYRYTTYMQQNHGIIEELLRRHGVDLNFVGVILYPAAADDIAHKERLAEYAVKLARMLDIQGACSTYAGGGHPCVEFMLICQKSERAGIKTVQVMPESYGTPEDPGFVYSVPEAQAIVSTGRSTHPIDLPALPRVLGASAYFDLAGDPHAAISVPYRYILGCCVPSGSGLLVGRQY